MSVGGSVGRCNGRGSVIGAGEGYGLGPLLRLGVPSNFGEYPFHSSVVCWSGICGLGSIEIGSLGPIGTLPLDHKAGFPESQFGLLPDINKPPTRREEGD